MVSRILSVLTVSIALSAVFALSTPHSVQAAVASDWKAGSIIEDSLFYDNNSMTVEEVQHFLNLLTPVCDTQGSQSAAAQGYPNLTRAQYASRQGWPGPPYICLKDYRQMPRSDVIIDNFNPNNDLNGSMSAAQIIKSAADSFRVSPKALIVLLHKESPGPLTVDAWPLQSQYRNAMGYACPDTAPCDPQYAGFYNQVTNAAKRIKSYKDNATSYRHQPYRTNSVYYNPNLSGCGNSPVYIESFATAGLYNYTPYQPNKAALDNLYGTGDQCSAYGNRNFWRIYTDWFGPTRTSEYPWTIVGAHIFDETKSTEMVTDRLHKDERLLVTLKVRNDSGQTWYRDGNTPTLLGTSNPTDSFSKYCDILWPSCNRAARLLEASVPPGGEGHFEFYIHAPAEGGEFRQYFRPVTEYVSWSRDNGWHIYVNSTNYFDWQRTSFTAWTDSTKTTPVSLDDVAANQIIYLEMQVKNMSATIWRNSGNNPIRLGTTNPHDSNSPFCTATWIACNRIATSQETQVMPGQTATFGFPIKAPSAKGQYRQYFLPLIEYRGWMRDDGNHVYLNVTR